GRLTAAAARVVGRAAGRAGEGAPRVRRPGPRHVRGGALGEGPLHGRAEDAGPGPAPPVRVVPAARPDPPPWPVLGLPAHGGREGPLDLRAERGRAVAVRG